MTDAALNSLLTVLVVDDDPGINLLLRTRLGFRGLTVLSAEDGEEALDVIARTPIDMMLLDVSMPVKGGMEVLADVRARGLDLTVIMTTASGAEQVGIDAMKLGADDYLRKPFDSAELKSMLDRHIALLHKRRALRG